MPNHVMNKLQFKGDQKRIDEILEKIKVDDIGIGTIDFNKIIPMPECLDVESGSRTIDAISHYMSLIKPFGHCIWNLPEAEVKFGIKMPTITVSEYNDLRDAILKDRSTVFFTDNLAFHQLDKDLVLAGEKYVDNFKKYKHTTWYGWCCENWGTKWNSYGYKDDCPKFKDNTIYFKTAWNSPKPVIDKLAKMFPDVTIEHSWADEDSGNNTGRTTYTNGKRINFTIKDNTKESYELYAKLWNEDLEKNGYRLTEDGKTYKYHEELDKRCGEIL